MVVLGPGGERFLHALADGHRPDSLPGRDGEAWHVQELDGPAGHLHFLVEPAGRVHRAIGRSHLGSRLRGGS